MFNYLANIRDTPFCSDRKNDFLSEQKGVSLMFDIKKLTILCKYDILKYVNFLVYKITYMLSKNYNRKSKSERKGEKR